jgi:hypothetical protein
MVHLEDWSMLPMQSDKGSNQLANFNLEARRQPAALIMENVRGAEIDGLRVSWPATGAPSQVKAGPQRAPGSADPPHAVLWARRVIDSRIEAPFVAASHPGHPAAVVADCPGSVIRVGRGASAQGIG